MLYCDVLCISKRLMIFQHWQTTVLMYYLEFVISFYDYHFCPFRVVRLNLFLRVEYQPINDLQVSTFIDKFKKIRNNKTKLFNSPQTQIKTIAFETKLQSKTSNIWSTYPMLLAWVFLISYLYCTLKDICNWKIHITQSFVYMFEDFTTHLNRVYIYIYTYVIAVFIQHNFSSNTSYLLKVKRIGHK